MQEENDLSLSHLLAMGLIHQEFPMVVGLIIIPWLLPLQLINEQNGIATAKIIRCSNRLNRTSKDNDQSRS